jgi:hypothetical protein
MIAANSVSSGVSCVPPPCGRTFDGGISGSAISHSPSGTIQLHVPRPIDSPTSDHHIGHRLTSCLAGCRRLHRRYERKAERFLAFVGIAATLIGYRRLAALLTA